MNSNVHPLVATLVLALTGVAIAIWMWAYGEAASIGGPAELGMDPQGHVYVQIQNKLVEHDQYGEFIKTHSLEDLGVELFLGGFAFFSDGDVLLRRGPDPRSFGDNLRAFQRKTNHETTVPASPESGLYRCDLNERSCVQFGDVGIDFKAAHGLFIDRSTDDVFISDTTRHVLRKYAADGAELAGPLPGFKFPNQLLLHDQLLYVADTNNHVLRVLDPNTKFFGVDVDRVDVVPPLAASVGRDWPSHFARVGDGWWVNVMRTGMNEGGIYSFDDQWHIRGQIATPEGADPISILALADEVWVSDWNNDKVRRFTLAGESLPDLESAGLERVLTASRAERTKFEWLRYSGVAMVVLILGGLLVRGLSVGMAQNPPVSAPAAQPSDSSVHLEPDSKLVRRMMRSLQLVGVLILVMMLLLVYFIAQHDMPGFGEKMILPFTGLLAVYLLIYWVSRANLGTSISVRGGVVKLRDHRGRESSCALQDIRYDDSAIATHDVVVFLGRPIASVYRRAEIDDNLFPSLGNAQKVSPLTMQKILFQMRHPQGILTGLAVFGVVIYAVWTLI